MNIRTPISLIHTTHYEFDHAVGLGMHTIRLRPAPHSRALVTLYEMNITPAQHSIHWQQDPFGNFQASVIFPDKMTELKVEIKLEATLESFNPFDFFLDNNATHYPLIYTDALKNALYPYRQMEHGGTAFKAWLENLNRDKTPIFEFLGALNTHIYQTIAYTQRWESGIQTSDTTLTLKSGSCRDVAWLLCQSLRHLGLAARFVSGYRIQLDLDGKLITSDDNPNATEDLHAWTEVYLPGAGWLGLDPTTGFFVGEGYIPLSASDHPNNSAPISGAMEECKATLTHKIQVMHK